MQGVTAGGGGGVGTSKYFLALVYLFDPIGRRPFIFDG
jgi:hypothetical protein